MCRDGRTRWRAVGIVWGLASGLVAAYVGAAYLLGLLWLWVFGDGTWPGWIALAVVAVAVLAFAAGAAAGYLAIRRVVAPRSRAGTETDRRRALLWGGAGVAVVVLHLAWWGSIGSERPEPTAHDRLPAGHADDWRRSVSLAVLRERARAILLDPDFVGSAAADVVVTVEGSARVPGDRHPVHARRSTVEHTFRF